MWCSHEWLLQCSCCGCYRFGDSNKRGGQTKSLEEATNQPTKQRMNERRRADRKGGMVVLGIGVLWYFYPGYDKYIHCLLVKRFFEFNNYRSYLKSKCKDPWGIRICSSEVNGTKRCCCCLDVVWLKDWLGVLEERESSLKFHFLLQKTTFLFHVRKYHLGGRKCLRSGRPQNDSSEPQAHWVLDLKSYDSTLGVHSVLVCFGPLKWLIRRFYQKLVWGGKRKEEKFGRQY